MSEDSYLNVDLSVEQIIRKSIGGLQNDFSSLLSNSTEQLQQRIRDLESQLTSSRNVTEYFQMKLEDAKREREILESKIDQERNDYLKELSQLQRLDRHIVCLIDGDGAIFTLSSLARGQAGGRAAAAKLTEAVRTQFPSEQYQLVAWVFFNKQGLLDTLKKYGKEEARRGLEDFVIGFNQSAERFVMVDAGSGKEAADAKIKAFLEDEAKGIQTIKVVFGGCHDNGYLTTIRSIVTQGYGSKLTLLRGYKDMAAGFASLEIPSLAVPDLFEAQKLGPCSPTLAPASPPGLSKELIKNSPPSFGVVSSNAAPGSYRAALQSTQHPMQSSPRRGSAPRARHPDPTKPLSKQDPPPCNVFYLTKGCKFGASCSFAHDYILKPEHLEEMRESAKKSPCATMNRDEECPFGENCCYGHKCPFLPRCHFYKLGTCKFGGAGMHSE